VRKQPNTWLPSPGCTSRGVLTSNALLRHAKRLLQQGQRSPPQLLTGWGVCSPALARSLGGAGALTLIAVVRSRTARRLCTLGSLAAAGLFCLGQQAHGQSVEVSTQGALSLLQAGHQTRSARQ
jgi:hypothetical protein